MTGIAAILLLYASSALQAGDTPGFACWSASDLKKVEQSLGPKIDNLKVAVQQLGQFGNHSVIVVHRQGDGEAEVHDGQTDVLIVQSGAGSLAYGGTVVAGKDTAPGEIRGKSITGGATKALAPGDVMRIPPRMPHQVMVPPGKQITYLIVKVDAP